jgi:hypothetical protein
MANYVNATLKTTLDNIDDFPPLQSYLDPNTTKLRFEQKNKKLPNSFDFQWTTKEGEFVISLFEEFSATRPKEEFELSVSFDDDYYGECFIHSLENGKYEFVKKSFNYWVECEYDILDKELESNVYKGIEYLKSLDKINTESRDNECAFCEYHITIQVQAGDWAIDVSKNDNVIEVKNLRKKIVETITKETWEPIAPGDNNLPF